jgi:hypothetical protein
VVVSNAQPQGDSERKTYGGGTFQGIDKGFVFETVGVVVGLGGPDSVLTMGVDMTAVLRRVFSGVRWLVLLVSPDKIFCSESAGCSTKIEAEAV